MLQTLKLLLPALIPSWRFFDRIAPSPRIEFTLLEAERDAPGNWQEYRPRPERLSFGGMLKRLAWNPRWNESLFLVSCAERIMAAPTEHSIREIAARIRASARHSDTHAAYLQFRLIFVTRQDTELQKHITFISPVYRFSENA